MSLGQGAGAVASLKSFAHCQFLIFGISSRCSRIWSALETKVAPDTTWKNMPKSRTSSKCNPLSFSYLSNSYPNDVPILRCLDHLDNLRTGYPFDSVRPNLWCSGSRNRINRGRFRNLSGASARSRLAGSTCWISAGRMGSIVLAVKQAWEGHCGLAVFSAPAAAIRFR